jgi:hypothetical protein
VHPLAQPRDPLPCRPRLCGHHDGQPGVKSYREGKAFYFDKDTGQVHEADSAWSARWEERSKLRGKPNQVIGWKAGDTGSLLGSPEYQKLEGDWINGKDPAENA